MTMVFARMRSRKLSNFVGCSYQYRRECNHIYIYFGAEYAPLGNYALAVLYCCYKLKYWLLLWFISKGSRSKRAKHTSPITYLLPYGSIAYKNAILSVHNLRPVYCFPNERMKIPSIRLFLSQYISESTISVPSRKTK